ncbi:MAG: hypothetical protein COV29_03015 [Candidatus Yanofskybacteria bacterium CG10_big_fil_rev_8_21_14_0_10_36_16]|uniref:POTRA domain-containing protein n=1 Tax=Candidatus Yanofskybacteria bacterium CG10_big_fil_rev_8_21_14_0_10_36_16 TaxID=1975096 RepID=A0A2J0Q6V1_9BACT|nr:MAG: hypothetical protein COV29_03015 [Candidatus Yanofskybacteria bacterium CG10_big_fil_rev_8_21_14_0_10_36_16]
MRQVKRFKDDYGEKKRRRARTRALLILIAIIFALGGFFYFLFLSGKFEVQGVNITVPEPLRGDVIKTATDEWLQDRKFGIARKNNILFLKSDDLSKFLAEKFPEVKEIEINKDKNYVLELFLTKREPEGIWCSDPDCFYFDNEYVVYAQTVTSSGFVITVIKDYRDNDLKVGDYIESIWVENSLIAKKEFEEKGILIKEIQIPKNSNDEFHLIAAEGFSIYMSLFTDIKKQVEALLIAWDEKITEEEKEMLEYIDLRLPDRIYYKQY